MNSWSNAIIVILLLVAGAWLLIVAGPEPPKPEPKPPGPVVQPVESVEQGNPIQMYRDIQKLVAFAGQMQIAIEAAGRELARTDLQTSEWKEPTVEEPTEWAPDERQAVLYFYADNDLSAHVAGSKLLRAGHAVYRVPTRRLDLIKQYGVRTTPTWLVIRDNNIIYRSTHPPVFPSPEPVRGPVYYSPAVRGPGVQCSGGICQ